MEEIKVSELPVATNLNDSDLLMIIQGGVNKQVQSKIFNKVQDSTITTQETIAENTDYTIPLNYKVGADVLEIYYMGEKLIKDTHYIEVGNTGAISNTIQFYNWGQSVPTGRTIEFVVRGVYSNES